MSAKQTGRSAGEQVPRFAETPPPYQGSDYSFTLQGILGLQKDVGKLQEAVDTLKAQSKTHDDKLDKISLRIYGATAVLVFLGTGLGFLMNKGVDLLIQLLGKH